MPHLDFTADWELCRGTRCEPLAHYAPKAAIGEAVHVYVCEK
ncbi:MAG: hypothetical protein ACREXI_02655 [Caldimonas sp.]